MNVLTCQQKTSDNENGDDGADVEAIIEKIKLNRKTKSEIIKENLDDKGEKILLPLRHADSSTEHDVEEAPWKKGGMLPPRLYIEHDFRQHSNDCALAVPEVKARKAKTQSVFDKANQISDIPPLVRYKVNGSQVTKHEKKRLGNIKAIAGRFGKTVKIDPNARKTTSEDPRLLLNRRQAAKAKVKNAKVKKDKEGRAMDISEGRKLNLEKNIKLKNRRMTVLADGSLMPFQGM